jgi:hypothetical protein
VSPLVSATLTACLIEQLFLLRLGDLELDERRPQILDERLELAVGDFLVPACESLVLGLAGVLHAEGEAGLALLVDLRVEHLVLKVGRGLRLQEHACPGGLDDLVVLAGNQRGCELEPGRVTGIWGGGSDPQARPLGDLRV